MKRLHALTLALIPALSRAQLLPNCPPREVVPYQLQGYGDLRRPASGTGPGGRNMDYVGNYSVLGNGLEHYGPSFFRGRAGTVGTTGVLSTACISSVTREPDTGYYDFIFSREDVHNSPSSFCGIVSVTLEPGSSTMNDVALDYHAMEDNFPPCKSNGKAPSQTVITGYDHQGFFVGRCPGPTEVTPPLLSIQPPYRITLNIVDDYMDVDSKFSPSAWVDVYLGGAVTVQSCILSITTLDPSLSQLPGAVALWQVVYGDPATGKLSGCGWYAQIGAVTTAVTADLSFDINFVAATGPQTLVCPKKLLGNVNLTTLTGYFTTPLPPSAAAAAASISAGAVVGIVLGVGAGLFAAGLATLYFTGRWVPGVLYTRVAGVDGAAVAKGGFSDGAAPSSSEFTAVNAEGEEEEVECVPVATAAAMAKDVAQGARRAMSFSVQ